MKDRLERSQGEYFSALETLSKEMASQMTEGKVKVPGFGVEVEFVGTSIDGGKVYASNLWPILSKAAEEMPVKGETK